MAIAPLGSQHRAATEEHASPGRRASAAGPALPLVGAGLALVASSAYAAVGGSPAALLVVTIAFATTALRPHMHTATALAATLLGAVTTLAVTMRLAAVTDFPLTGLLVLPAVVAAVCLVVLWRRGSLLGDASRAELLLAGGLVALSLVQTLAVSAFRALSGLPKLAWLMNNDSPWNVVSSRFIVEDGGLDPSSHRNPAPLTNELVALFVSPGRSGLDPGDLLRHDLLRTSQLLLLLVAATSLLAGLLVASAVPRHLPWSRAALAGVAAVLPWTYAIAGQAFVFGFWNSLPTLVLVLACWAAWTEATSSPRLSSALLATAGTGLLAAWAPLVMLPAALGVAVVGWHLRAHLALRGLRLVAWLAPLLVLAAYAATVSLDDFSVAGGGLAADGGFPPFDEHVPVVILGVAVAVTLMFAAWSGSRWELAGVGLLAFVGIAGTYYLMGQRAGIPSGPWGYYPQKFAWTLCVLAPFVLLRSVSHLLGHPGLVRQQRASLVLGTAVLAGALVLQIPPADPRPISFGSYPVPHRTPDYRLSSLWPIASMAYPDRSSALDPAVETVLDLADEPTKDLVSRWTGDPGANGFINFWLLQLPVDRVDEAPRTFAYSLDSNDPAELCELVVDWGGGVRIHTRSPSLDDEMADACPDGDFEVVRRR